MEQLKPLLTAIRDLCINGHETDAVELAQKLALPRDSVCELLEQADGLGLAHMEEFGFSCSVEYSVTGLTDAGNAWLNTK